MLFYGRTNELLLHLMRHLSDCRERYRIHCNIPVLLPSYR